MVPYHRVLGGTGDNEQHASSHSGQPYPLNTMRRITNAEATNDVALDGTVLSGNITVAGRSSQNGSQPNSFLHQSDYSAMSHTESSLPYPEEAAAQNHHTYNPQDYAYALSSPLIGHRHPYRTNFERHSQTTTYPLYNPANYREINSSSLTRYTPQSFHEYPQLPFDRLGPLNAGEQNANYTPLAPQSTRLSMPSSCHLVPPPPPIPVPPNGILDGDHGSQLSSNNRQVLHSDPRSTSRTEENDRASLSFDNVHNDASYRLYQPAYSPFYITSDQIGAHAPVPPPHLIQLGDTVGRHPHSRPLPGPPEDERTVIETGGDRHPSNRALNETDPEVAQESLYEEVENTLLQHNQRSYSQTVRETTMRSRKNSADIYLDPPSLNTNSLMEDGRVAHRASGSQFNNSGMRRYSPPGSCDLVAEAGLEALRLADAQEKEEEKHHRKYRNSEGAESSIGRICHEIGPENELTNVDVGLYSGGFPGYVTYGPNLSVLEAAKGSSNADEKDNYKQTSVHDESLQGNADIMLQPSNLFSSDARVDTYGTGGLSEPNDTRRRLSFDEGDEDLWMNEAGEPPELFYHPGIGQRPLPKLPDESHTSASFYGSMSGSHYLHDVHAVSEANLSTAPNNHHLSISTGAAVPRASSLVSRSHTPPTVTPIRAKTDAEERRLRQQQSKSLGSSADFRPDFLDSQSASNMAVDLPTLPAGKRFVPAKLTVNDFRKCVEPWALTSMSAWLRTMADGEQDLREHAVFDGLVLLITNKIPTLGIADAESLSTQIIQELFKAGTLIQEEEWVKFGPGEASGVFYQLSGMGCYAAKLHNYSMNGRCYSYHCQRTLKKISLDTQAGVPRSEDWRTFYNVKEEDLVRVCKDEIDRQNILHEIVVTEDGFIDQLNVLKIVYKDAIASSQPPIIAPKWSGPFLLEVFGKVDLVRKANETYLLPQLKYRQQEQGPWLNGFSDIFREWVRKAKHAYVEYAAGFPRANFLVRQEVDRNVLFRTFLEQARSHRLSNKLGWDTYLKAPITRLQRYGLLLSAVYKKTNESEEKKNLQIVLNEIKAVTMECDAIVADMSRKVDLADLQAKLVMRRDMPHVELNLDHLGRSLMHKGDLLRLGTTKFTWLDIHALLFDHYLVLAKLVRQKDSSGNLRFIGYDVSRQPVPMDLLMLESANDDPITKSRGLTTAVAGVTRLQSGSGNTSNASITTVPLSGNGNTNNTTTVASSFADQSSENILYPFRIKHLGKDEYTLYATTMQNRREWCEKIIEAKINHAASLFAQNAEPFRLRVIADAAFSYEGVSIGQQSILIKGTPLYRALKDMEKQFESTGRPGPICRARVNCATTFFQSTGSQKISMIAVGCDYGVFLSEADNPRTWTRALLVPKVTQMAVIEEFGIFILISDKTVIAYHLDHFCQSHVSSSIYVSARKAPQKLSGSRDVGFFATGRIKDRTLVIYKKRDGISSIFKVLEPVYQKSSGEKSRFARTGITELFREYDGFYTPAECYGMNLFHTYISLSTSKGFEVLTLDKKQPTSIPDLKQSHVSSIASRLAEQNPLGMFRLSDQEFLLCYNECAVYVNKHGDISRSVIMSFVGKARSAAFYGPYVLLFDQDFLEIRNAQNGRLRQVISGRDIKCLDDGQNGSSAGQRTIKICMQHPEQERSQLLLELLLNEGQAD